MPWPRKEPKMMLWAQMKTVKPERVAYEIVDKYLANPETGKKGRQGKWFVFFGSKQVRTCTPSDSDSHLAQQPRRWIGTFQLPVNPTLNEQQEVVDLVAENIEFCIRQHGERLFHATGGAEGCTPKETMATEQAMTKR